MSLIQTLYRSIHRRHFRSISLQTNHHQQFARNSKQFDKNIKRGTPLSSELWQIDDKIVDKTGKPIDEDKITKFLITPQSRTQ